MTRRKERENIHAGITREMNPCSFFSFLLLTSGSTSTQTLRPSASFPLSPTHFLSSVTTALLCHQQASCLPLPTSATTYSDLHCPSSVWLIVKQWNPLRPSDLLFPALPDIQGLISLMSYFCSIFDTKKSKQEALEREEKK